MKIANHWIFSKTEDLLVFALPLLVAGAALVYLQSVGLSGRYPPPYWIYAVAVVFIDLGHVYSTLFRTYFDRRELAARRLLYLLTPALCFSSAVVLTYYYGLLTLQIYIYLNIYHFVRQQYGWMMLASRKETGVSGVDRFLDKLIIYTVTVYPVLWWHFHDIGFTWRDPAQYFALPGGSFEPAITALHWGIVALYVARQIGLVLVGRPLNLAKQLIWVTTFCTWYFGIVYSRSLLAFSLTQQFTHGLPYMYLVYRYQQRQREIQTEFLGRFFRGWGFIWYLAVILLLGLYADLAPALYLLVERSRIRISIVTGIILLPAATHFVLDGFLWRLRKPKTQRFREFVGPVPIAAPNGRSFG